MMNWEKFDDQFREKLENIPHEYDEKEWTRFNKKFSPKEKPVVNIFTRNFAKIAASIGISSLVYFSYAQYQVGYKLKNELKEIEIQNKKLTVEKQNYELRISEIIKKNDSLVAKNEEYLASITGLKPTNSEKNLSKNRKIVKNGKKKVKIKTAIPAKVDTVKKDKFFGKLIKGFKGLFKGKKSKKTDSTEVEFEVDSISIKN